LLEQKPDGRWQRCCREEGHGAQVEVGHHFFGDEKFVPDLGAPWIVNIEMVECGKNSEYDQKVRITGHNQPEEECQ